MPAFRFFCSEKWYEMQIFFVNIPDLPKLSIGELSKLDGLFIKVKLFENGYFKL